MLLRHKRRSVIGSLSLLAAIFSIKIANACQNVFFDGCGIVPGTTQGTYSGNRVRSEFPSGTVVTLNCSGTLGTTSWITDGTTIWGEKVYLGCSDGAWNSTQTFDCIYRCRTPTGASGQTFPFNSNILTGTVTDLQTYGGLFSSLCGGSTSDTLRIHYYDERGILRLKTFDATHTYQLQCVTGDWILTDIVQTRSTTSQLDIVTTNHKYTNITAWSCVAKTCPTYYLYDLGISNCQNTNGVAVGQPCITDTYACTFTCTDPTATTWNTMWTYVANSCRLSTIGGVEVCPTASTFESVIMPVGYNDGVHASWPTNYADNHCYIGLAYNGNQTLTVTFDTLFIPATANNNGPNTDVVAGIVDGAAVSWHNARTDAANPNNVKYYGLDYNTNCNELTEDNVAAGCISPRQFTANRYMIVVFKSDGSNNAQGLQVTVS